MKSRLTLADVLAEVRDLRALILDARLVNIFDVNEKTFLFKLAGASSKTILLMESGVRVHTTAYARERPVQPSGFTMKLRKHLRNKRLVNLTQVGVDRVLDFQFGEGGAAYHVILELYDRGNVVLCDAAYTILALLRGYTLDVGAGGKAAAGADAAEAGAEGGAEGEGGGAVQAAAAAKGKGGGKGGKGLGGKGKGGAAGAAAPSPAGPGAAAAGAPPSDTVRIAVRQMYAFATEGHGLRSAVMGRAAGEEGAEGAPAPAEPSSSVPLDATWAPSTLAPALAAYLASYDARVVSVMPTKTRKKLTLAACLVAKGSGLDVYGPALVEHACALAGLGAEGPLEGVKRPGAAPPPGPKTGKPAVLKKGEAPPPPAAPPSAEDYDQAKLERLAGALGGLPDLLHALAHVPGPAYAIVEATEAEAAAEGGMNSLLQRVAGGPAPGPPSVVPFALPVAGGALGSWGEVQSRVREHIAGGRGAGGEEAPPTPPAVEATDAAAPAAPAPSVDEDNEVGPGQLPPTLPFRLVDFTPALLAQHRLPPRRGGPPPTYVTFPSFDAAVDEYFSRLDVEKAEKRGREVKSAGMRRLERIREGHAGALAGLTAAQGEAYTKGRVLEAEREGVDAACAVVRSALEHGVSWLELGRLVESEAEGGNAIARLILPDRMKLGEGRIVLALRDREAEEEAREVAREKRAAARRAAGEDSEEEEEEGEEEEEEEDEPEEEDGDSDGSGGEEAGGKGKGGKKGGKGGKEGKGGKDGKGKAVKLSDAAVARAASGSRHSLLVEVDVLVTAAANARVYYGAGKAAKEKEGRTLAAADHAIRAAEKGVAAAAAMESAAAAASRTIRIARKPHWFERFHWFITSEGLVAVAGKSAQDNEVLVKRYLRPQDAYVHADVHGAASVVLRSSSSDVGSGDSLPALSLAQAGHFCVCLSSAWAAAAPTSAWWVSASQVSKTAPTGEYLGTGSFMVRGRKNMLPPVRLELGLAVLFRVDEGCLGAHLNDRRVRGGEEGAGAAGGGEDRTLVRMAERQRVAAEEEEEAEARRADVAAAAAAATAEEAGGTVTASSAPLPAHIRRAAKKLEKTGGLTAEEAVKAALEAAAAEPAPAPAPAAGGAAAPDVAKAEKGGQKGAAEKGAGGGKGKPPAVVAPPPAPAAAPAGAGPKRGQKSRQRKAEEKYGEQDEEDRARALEALGHRVAKVTLKEGEGGSTPAAAAAAGADAPAAPAPRAPRPPKAPKPEEEGEEEEGEGGAGEGASLPLLVAWPLKDDILTHAVPMLCPYPVCLTAKYRVKISPGGLKKGKAGAAALHAWSTAAKVPGFGTERERELLRTLGDNELVAVLVSGCKVTPAAAAAGHAPTASSRGGGGGGGGGTPTA